MVALGIGIGVGLSRNKGGGGGPYEGYPLRLAQGATRGLVFNGRSTGYRRIGSRMGAYARVPLVNPVLDYANWGVNGSTFAEQSSGGTLTIAAAIEYPEGVFTQAKFGGATSGTGAAGTVISSDPTTGLTIPEGALFWVRSYAIFASNGLYLDKVCNPAMGDAMEHDASTLTNKTMGGTFVDEGTGFLYGPMAIKTPHKRAVFYHIGDSRNQGTSDTKDSSLDLGEISRTIGEKYAYVSDGIAGDRAFAYLASGASRTAIGTDGTVPGGSTYQVGVTHVICEYGINDQRPDLGRTLAQLQADWLSIWGSFLTRKVYQTTMPPYCESGSNTVSTTNGVRTAANDWLRDGAPISGGVAVAVGTAGATRAGQAGHPLTGYFEVADVVESSRNSGLWKTPTPAYTTDFIHETQAGNLAIKSSKVIDPAIP